MTEKKILTGLFFITAVLYVGLLSIHPYSLSIIIRPVPMLIFAYLCIKYLPLPENILLGIGFICCCVGDIFMDLSREQFFIQALVSFLFGHIFYGLGFLRSFHFSKKGLFLACLAFAYPCIIALILIPRLGSFLVPVLIYILVILCMGICAAFVKNNTTGIFTGAMLFIISDSLIAINKFLAPFPYSTPIIISIYFIAQYFIGSGILSMRDRKS